jgi:hypothetical protein
MLPGSIPIFKNAVSTAVTIYLEVKQKNAEIKNT